MAKQQKTRERVFDLQLRKMEQIDLSGTPVCVTDDFSDPLIEEIHLLFREDSFGTIADTLAIASDNLADSTKRRRFLRGETQSYFHGKIWLKTADGSSKPGALDKEVYEQGRN